MAPRRKSCLSELYCAARKTPLTSPGRPAPSPRRPAPSSDPSWRSCWAHGEVLPDLVFFQELLGRYLDLCSRQLAQVDGRNSEDRRQGRALRQERERQMTKVRGVLRDARYLLDRQLGRESSAVHLKDRTFARRDAASLVQLAREAATALRDPKVAWEPATLEGVGSGSAELAEVLDREARQLEQLSQDQEGLQSRQQQAGLEEKAAELEKAKVAIRGGANSSPASTPSPTCPSTPSACASGSAKAACPKRKEPVTRREAAGGRQEEEAMPEKR